MATPAQDLLVAKETVDLKLALCSAQACRSPPTYKPPASTGQPSALTALPPQASQDHPECKIIIVEQSELPTGHASSAHRLQLPDHPQTKLTSSNPHQETEVLLLQQTLNKLLDKQAERVSGHTRKLLEIKRQQTTDAIEE